MDQYLYFSEYNANEYSVNKVFLGTLSADEKVRYYNYKYDIDRQKFLQRHLKLQQILLSHNLKDLDLFYSNSGQPVFKSKLNKDTTWKISLSATNSAFVIFISNNNPIGVDIELLKTIDLRDSLIKMVLHKTEIEVYNNMSYNYRVNYFYQTWTKKEAYVKAFGKGLLVDLTEIKIDSIQANSMIKTIFLGNYLVSYCILEEKWQ